jgi:phosphatidylglycerol---prolipoprotein diacylglyceryl transferase
MTVYWNMNPEIFQIGFLAPRWYGVMFAAAFLVGSFIGSWIFKRENQPPESLDRILLYMLFGTVIGARLGECLFYNPSYYLSNPIEIFKIWKGGLASHGAGIGLFISTYLYARNTPGQSYIWILDRGSIVVALSGCFIRLGNLFNSEIIGKPTESHWGFVFQRIDSLPRHPAQLYESALYLLIFVLLMTIYLKADLNKIPGLLIGPFLIMIFSVRFVIEFLKENQVGFESDLILNMGQFLSIPMILLGIFILIRISIPAIRSARS